VFKLRKQRLANVQHTTRLVDFDLIVRIAFKPALMASLGIQIYEKRSNQSGRVGRGVNRGNCCSPLPWSVQ